MKDKRGSLTIYIDGASKGNPGKAGIGVVIYDENGKKIKELSKSIGVTTNNVAEYVALVYALQECLLLGSREITIYTDSELLYNQLKNTYKVKNDNLKILLQLAQHLVTGFNKFQIECISGESNKVADKLASQGIK